MYERKYNQIKVVKAKGSGTFELDNPNFIEGSIEGTLVVEDTKINKSLFGTKINLYGKAITSQGKTYFALYTVPSSTINLYINGGTPTDPYYNEYGDNIGTFEGTVEAQVLKGQVSVKFTFI